MASNSVEKIRQNYAVYKSIVYDIKRIALDPVRFTSTKDSRPDFHYHECFVKHDSIDDILLMAEQRMNVAICYKFQIRCKSFYEKPLFRLDSDGATHKNYKGPLKNQQVLTPHYNMYDEEGRPIAFKDDLEGISNEELSDINRFFQLFCGKCKILSHNNDHPNILPANTGLLFDISTNDMLEDINF